MSVCIPRPLGLWSYVLLVGVRSRGVSCTAKRNTTKNLEETTTHPTRTGWPPIPPDRTILPDISHLRLAQRSSSSGVMYDLGAPVRTLQPPF
ncbi:hypothetical protein C8Q80DRAFT_121988 [Daedaleopsis nitida]|nr:hypothetical protein C8Q80DRAFT_121988 [Daedaleopsis nitida]